MFGPFWGENQTGEAVVGKPCDACGASTTITIRTTNGMLHLCGQCRDDIDRKSPLLAAVEMQRDALVAGCRDALEYAKRNRLGSGTLEGTLIALIASVKEDREGRTP